ncbi:hypothetical protein LWI29_026951 [Acer saccharum]|uniref:phosphoribosyl-ATP diphosphatase n=1 Tax=Acer saccharum TaxID=4024 RepID=A0AA39TWK1_ACESA|nr:hypothetical protein LWI29_026951 [Acer saccharum]
MGPSEFLREEMEVERREAADFAVKRERDDLMSDEFDELGFCVNESGFVNWEEADELCRTVEENEDKSRTASKMADVMYHAMVLLTIKNVKTEEVLEVLRQK